MKLNENQNFRIMKKKRKKNWRKEWNENWNQKRIFPRHILFTNIMNECWKICIVYILKQHYSTLLPTTIITIIIDQTIQFQWLKYNNNKKIEWILLAKERRKKRKKTDQIEWMNDGGEKLYTTYLSIYLSM